MSHMPFMDSGQIRHDSVALTGWRQDLCLRQDLYEPDVTAKLISQLPDLIERLEGRADPNENRLVHTADEWLKDRNNSLASFGFAQYLQSSTNQLTDVKRPRCWQVAACCLGVLWWLLCWCCCCICMSALLHWYACCGLPQAELVFSRCVGHVEPSQWDTIWACKSCLLLL